MRRRSALFAFRHGAARGLTSSISLEGQAAEAVERALDGAGRGVHQAAVGAECGLCGADLRGATDEKLAPFRELVALDAIPLKPSRGRSGRMVNGLRLPSGKFQNHLIDRKKGTVLSDHDGEVRTEVASAQPSDGRHSEHEFLGSRQIASRNGGESDSAERAISMLPQVGSDDWRERRKKGSLRNCLRSSSGNSRSGKTVRPAACHSSLLLSSATMSRLVNESGGGVTRDQALRVRADEILERCGSPLAKLQWRAKAAAENALLFAVFIGCASFFWNSRPIARNMIEQRSQRSACGEIPPPTHSCGGRNTQALRLRLHALQ